MKRFIFILVSFLFVLSAAAQVKQEVISSAGGYNVATGISISWTLGETIIPTFKSSDNSLILAHGFQSVLLTVTIEDNIEPQVTIKIYPNPSSENINIKFEEPVDDEVKIFLFNSRGQLVKTDVVEVAVIEKQMNLQDLPSGVYYLKLVKGKLSNVYKVVKL
jgi:hypothetical protein